MAPKQSGPVGDASQCPMQLTDFGRFETAGWTITLRAGATCMLNLFERYVEGSGGRILHRFSFDTFQPSEDPTTEAGLEEQVAFVRENVHEGLTVARSEDPPPHTKRGYIVVTMMDPRARLAAIMAMWLHAPNRTDPTRVALPWTQAWHIASHQTWAGIAREHERRVRQDMDAILKSKGTHADQVKVREKWHAHFVASRSRILQTPATATKDTKCPWTKLIRDIATKDSLSSSSTQ